MLVQDILSKLKKNQRKVIGGNKKMKLKNILIMVMALSMVAFATADVIDYDTFDRTVLNTTEGEGHIYTTTDGASPTIENNTLIMDAYGEAYVNMSDTPLTEFTFYARYKSISTGFVSVFSLFDSAFSTEEIVALVDTDSYSPTYYMATATGNTPTATNISFDEWIDVYIYRDDATNTTNVTMTGDTTTYTNSIYSERPNLVNIYFYNEDATSLIMLDEWAVCDGYDLTCSPPEEVVEEEETVGYTAQYSAGDLAGASIDIVAKVFITLGLFITVIVLIIGFGYVKKKL